MRKSDFCCNFMTAVWTPRAAVASPNQNMTMYGAVSVSPRPIKCPVKESKLPRGKKKLPPRVFTKTQNVVTAPYVDICFSVATNETRQLSRTRIPPLILPEKLHRIVLAKMSFSKLVSDIAYRDSPADDRSSVVSGRPHSHTGVAARSTASTAATSVSISGDISSQLHAGYSHPLSRVWQAERQLTKVSFPCLQWGSSSATIFGPGELTPLTEG